VVDRPLVVECGDTLVFAQLELSCLPNLQRDRHPEKQFRLRNAVPALTRGKSSPQMRHRLRPLPAISNLAPRLHGRSKIIWRTLYAARLAGNAGTF
jgi:hypothetical protein